MLARIAARTAGIGVVLLALMGLFQAFDRDPAPAAAVHPSLLYGRVTTTDGETYEGRLRFGADEEAFWGDYFNGFRDRNRWAEQVPSDLLRSASGGVEVFGLTLWGNEREIDLRRPFMARFGDIARLEAEGRDLTVTLKSGSVAHLDRYAADDYADGVRIWDDAHGVVDLHEREVRSIDFMAPPRTDAGSQGRLHGTVHTRQGEFTGFLQWDREAGLATDEIRGRTADGDVRSLAFDGIRAIARRSGTSAVVTLRNGEDVVLADSRQVGDGHRGIYVDDARYGRVLISWDAFDRVDFTSADDAAAGSGPSYDDYPASLPLTGIVTTRDGRRLAGRLVYDLDESEFVETLDAPHLGVDYTIPFGMVSSIVLEGSGAEAAGRALVALRGGEQLTLERSGDLGDDNAGLLIFTDGGAHPEYVSWRDVARIDLAQPPAMYPPSEER